MHVSHALYSLLVVVFFITCFTLKGKEHSCSSFTVFVRGNLSTTMFFSLLTRFLGKALAIPTKCFVLDVAEVLHPLQ